MSSILGSSSFRALLRILSLAGGYWFSGWISLQLAIPPGFVSGLFLPMGIALGAILIWGWSMLFGVLIGSCLLNISVVLLAGQSFSWAVFSLAFEIALGSALAGAFGAWLIRRYVGFPNDLTDERKIFLFFILGGPIATSISASVGSLALFFNGIIQGKQLFYSWWTWWIGDAIGVLIATPLMCIFFAAPRNVWRNRRAAVGVPLVFSSIVVVVVFVMASMSEQKKMEAQFRQEAQVVVSSVKLGLSSVEYILAALGGLFISSDNVTRKEFSAYIDHVIVKKHGVSGFSWNRYVRRDERENFEQQMRSEGFEGFYIKEKNASGTFVKASERDDYVVIGYIEPWQENNAIHGLDVAVDPVRAAALNRALESNAFAVTSPLQLMQDKQYSPGVIAFFPVFDLARLNTLSANKKNWLLGYATAIVRTNDLIADTLTPFKTDDYNLIITDITQKANPLRFYTKGQVAIPAYAQDLILEERVVLGGRELLISVSPTEKFLSEHVSLQAWFVLAGGLLFCSLLGGFLLSISGRTQHVTNLVEQRTRELASIFENAAEAILVVDENGGIQKANPAAATLFAYPLADFRHLQIVALIPALQGRLNELHLAVLPSELRETIGQRSDGANVSVELSISPVDISEQKFFTFIIHDVTARRKVDLLKTEFISTVSHELRTPLTSIKGALSIVLSGNTGVLDEKANHLLAIAKNNADRLARLVNDILDIDKLEFGNVQLNMQPAPIYPLLKQAVEQNHAYAERYCIHLQLDLPREALMSLRVNIDADRFLQVMSNLISNAIKFSHRQSVVRVNLQREEDNILISVIDTGQGIPDEFRQRIFTKFAQADSSDTRRRDGTGLGLSITKVIVDAMGGSIDYVSTVNKGTTFTIRLPIVS